jgi:hypothetical protein
MWQTFKSSLQDFLCLSLGALCCAFLRDYLSLTSVLAASLAGLIGSLILYRSIPLQGLFYIGSFIAMTAPSEVSISFYVLSFMISYLTYFLFRAHFIGLGGKLGTTALIGTLGSFLIMSSLS